MTQFFTTASIIMLEIALILQQWHIVKLRRLLEAQVGLIRTYVDERIQNHVEADMKRYDEYTKILKECRTDYHEMTYKYNTEVASIQKSLTETAQKVEDLQRGIIPDYEKAKEAAKALDEFNESVAIIAGFDPMDAIRGRNGGAG